MSVPERPRLKPWYRLARVEDGFAVEYGESVLRFGGRAASQLLPLLLPLLDGTRTLVELAQALGEPLGPAIENALELLSEHRLLLDGVVDETPALHARTAAFLAAGSSEGLDEAHAAAALHESAVGIVGEGPLAAELVRILRLCGIGDVRLLDWKVGVAQKVSLAIAAPEASELTNLAGWNAMCLDVRRTWLQLVPFSGRLALVGPLYVPGETACYECYRLRRASNVAYEEEFWALEEAAPRRGSTPALDALVSGAAATLALRWILSRDPLVPGRLFSIGLDDALTVKAHEVFRVPRCPACSGLADVAGPLPWADAA